MNNSNVKQLFSKNLFVVFLIFLLAEGLKAEETFSNNTALEQLWKLTIQNNIDIQAASRNQELSDYDFNHYWRKFLPSISVSSSSTFSDPSSESSQIPETLTSSVTISENLPGGLSLALSPNVNLSRELTAGKPKMIEETKLSVSVSQRVLPYWLQKNKTGRKRIEDPEKTIQDLSQKLAASNSKTVILSTLEEITGKYIQYRIICRNINSVENRIELTQNILDVLKQLYQQGKISLSDIFSKEEELYKYMNDLQTYNSSKESILLAINKCLSTHNKNAPTQTQELVLPNHPLPSPVEPVFSVNPTYEYLKLQSQNLDAGFTLSKQNASPVLSLSGNIPIHNGYDESDFMGAYQSSNAKKWSVSVSLNLSPLTTENTKRTKLEYTNNKLTNKEKTESLLNNLSAEKEMFEKLLADSENQLELLQKNLEYYKKLLAAQKTLLKDGQITILEITQTEVEIVCKTNDINNCTDNIWYYNWLIQNRLPNQAR